MRSFVIVSRGRTGSTALASTLNAVPSIRCFQELLSPICEYTIEGSSPNVAGGICAHFAHSAQSVTLESWWGALIQNSAIGEQIVGFKALAHHFELRPELFDLVSSKFDVIHLTRDPCASAVSALYAVASGRYNFLNGSPEHRLQLNNLQSSSLELDADAVVLEAQYALEWQTRFSETVGELRGQFIRVRYEEIFSESSASSASIRAIEKFFGVGSISPDQSGWAKILVDRNSQIRNFGEVILKLQAAGFDTAILEGESS